MIGRWIWRGTLESAVRDRKKVMPLRGPDKAEIRRMIMELRRKGVSLAAYPSLRKRDSRLLASAMRRLRGGR